MGPPFRQGPGPRACRPAGHRPRLPGQPCPAVATPRPRGSGEGRPRAGLGFSPRRRSARLARPPPRALSVRPDTRAWSRTSCPRPDARPAPAPDEASWQPLPGQDAHVSPLRAETRGGRPRLGAPCPFGCACLASPPRAGRRAVCTHTRGADALPGSGRWEGAPGARGRWGGRALGANISETSSKYLGLSRSQTTAGPALFPLVLEPAGVLKEMNSVCFWFIYT